MTTQSFARYDLQDLANSLIVVLEGLSDRATAIVKIQRLLMEGHAVPPEAIAARLDIPQDEVATLLRQLGAELDVRGHLVGWGLSVVPTRHSYRVNGRQLYTWCAADAITFPIFHRLSAEIESPDPISGEMVRLIGTPEGARDIDPETAVVSWVPGTTDIQTVRATFCNFTNFFTSVHTASRYVATHPGLLIVPVNEVFQIGQLLWDREPYKSMMAPG
jgi:alkylmercury lyase